MIEATLGEAATGVDDAGHAVGRQNGGAHRLAHEPVDVVEVLTVEATVCERT
jgi:hypothetical protein